MMAETCSDSLGEEADLGLDVEPDSDSEECDDPGDTLTVPDAESIAVERSLSPREETDAGRCS